VEVNSELGLSFLLDNLDVDVEQAACIPERVRVEARFLFERVNVPEFDSETVRGERRPAPFTTRISSDTFCHCIPFGSESK
jgi:hypothetical protein